MLFFFLKKCKNSKCKNLHEKCQYVGEVITKKRETKCSFKKYKKNSTRKKLLFIYTLLFW